MQARLVKEKGQLLGQNYGVNEDSATTWTVTIDGPQTSAFQGGKFRVEMKLDNFPFKGPTVLFKTKIFHPNISVNGDVCAQMIGITDKWAPTKKLLEVIGKIKEMMLVPNPDMPLNQDAANSYKAKTWHQQASTWTNQYAK